MADWQTERQNTAAMLQATDHWSWQVTHLHEQPESGRILLPQTDTINFRSISPCCQWPLTAYSSLLTGFWLLRSTTWFTPTPSSSPLKPFFRAPAHVSFIRHVCGFQGLLERLLFFSCLSLLLFCSYIHSSIILSHIIFFHSQRRADPP